MRELVSVIIPSFNHGPYLRQAVESALHQDYSDIEVIVIDDGSRDDSLAILRSIADTRLSVYPQANQGAHAAINRGIQLAQGKYVSILNSDDFYAPHRISRCVEQFADKNFSLAFSYISVVDDAGKELGIKEAFYNMDPWPIEFEKSFKQTHSLALNLVTTNYLATTSNFFFRRELIEKIGTFRNLRYAHDWDFAFRARAQGEFLMLKQPLLSYRVHANNTIKQDKTSMVFEILWVLAMNFPGLGPEIARFCEGPERTASFLDWFGYSSNFYGCDKVLLSLMLLKMGAGSSPDRQLMEDLLERDCPARALLLEQVKRALGAAKNSVGEG